MRFEYGDEGDEAMKVIGILDLETTGLEPATGHVVEAALLLYSLEFHAIIRARSWLCAAPAEEVAKTEHVHSIPPALVAARGVPFEDVAKQISAIATKEIDVLTSYNVAFDKEWFPPFVQNAKPWACLCNDVDWPKRSSNRSLLSVAHAHGVQIGSLHRAMDDVQLCARLLDRCVEIGVDLSAMLARAMRPKVLVEATTPKPWEMADDEWAALKAQLQDAGFRFVEKPVKRWERRIAREDIGTLPFPTKECA